MASRVLAVARIQMCKSTILLPPTTLLLLAFFASPAFAQGPLPPLPPTQPGQPAAASPTQPGAATPPAEPSAPPPSAPSSPPAPASPVVETEERGVHTHDGFYLRMGIGPAYVSSTTEGSSSSLTGFGPGMELSFGGTIAPGLVLGGGSFGAAMLNPDPNIENVIVSTLGPFVDWYPDPHKGWHVQGMLGLARMVYTGKNNIPDASSDLGFSVGAGAGYELWIGEQWSMGILARVQYAHASMDEIVSVGGLTLSSNKSVGISAVSPALLLTFTYH